MIAFDQRKVERVSVTSAGEEGDGGWTDQTPLAISPDGRFVLLGNNSSNFAPGETDHNPAPLSPSDADAFVHDRKTGELDWVTVSSEGEEAQGGCVTDNSGLGNGGVTSGSLSNRGRLASYWSCADNLVDGDKNDAWDAFVRDRGLPLSIGQLIASGQARSLWLEGAPHFARTGTAWIDDAVPDAIASKLGTAGELLGARITYRPLLGDIFVVLELDSMPRTPALAAVTAGSVYGMSFNIDGKAYEIRSASTGLGPHGETTADFGLFSCPEGEPLCTKIEDLKGGFGTTGERITFSVPLDALGIEDGSVLSEVKAFTALGSFLGGADRDLDEAKLKK